MSDTLVRFHLRDAPVRGEIVSLDRAWLEIVNRHEVPASVRDRLGELSAAAMLLAASLKFDGALILQIHGDGPVALFVVECDARGRFRATVKLRDDMAANDDATLQQLVNRAGRGRFVVTLAPRSDDSTRRPYQGIVPFAGATVAAALEHYMERSEQVPTRLWLAADATRATGLLLQKLADDGGTPRAPGATPDADGWNRMQRLAETLSGDELLRLDSDDVLHRLFWHESIDALDRRECRFECRCSREKVAAMLRMLGPKEVQEIVAEQGRIEVRCEFCNLPYGFDAVDSAGLFIAGLESAPLSGPH